ncbi:MAG: DUF2961 domain-containing protein [Limisphaerales bacterium]
MQINHGCYMCYLQMEKGDNRMYRWYLLNPVRFQQSLKVELQNQHNNGTPTTNDADDYASVAFWYQEEQRSRIHHLRFNPSLSARRERCGDPHPRRQAA